ncbi:hypothetical protein ACP70R_011878 [Stipagrostis hirtigluma subsp. patula]
MPLPRFAALFWLGAALAATLPAAGALLPQPSSNCQRKCGEVDIPYPFGIGPGDSPDHCAMPLFNLSCKEDGPGASRLFHNDVEVLGIMLQHGQARMRMNMSYFCPNQSSPGTADNNTYWHLNLTGTPYRLSDTGNKFTVIGCQTLAYIADENIGGKYASGCVAMCRQDDISALTDGSCSGIGCCQTAIPKGLQYYQVWFDPGSNMDIGGCSYAALVEASNFTFSPSYATSPAFNDTYGGQAPLLVDWAIGRETCEEALKKPDSYACVSRNSQCLNSSNGPGYICTCSKGFQGNPYLVDGCEDIDECNSANYPCSVNGTCNNTPGGYDCICPPRYPKGNAYNGTCEQDQALPVKTKVAIGICGSVFACLILFLGEEWIKHKRRIIRQDHVRKTNEYFQQNGVQLLMDMMKVEYSNISFKLYHREEIELATKNFDNSAIIGQGGQGTVYLGYDLDPDNNPVAIKRCKGFDESRRMEFVKELLILSRVKHENIVKLLGCCLQFEAPVLVYEFVPNNTLHYLIHSQDDASIRTLGVRLKIAAESAEALAYLHSLNHPIFHGDVKSVNILLSRHQSAKVSDFGCSMIRSMDEKVQVVKGTMGYLDPEYLLKFELTEKSDVYSFGVVLLELLTRRKALSADKVSLVSVFKEALKEGQLGDLVDREIANQDTMELVSQFAELARQCLVMTGEHRPMMSQVAVRLRQMVDLVQQHTGALRDVSSIPMQGTSATETPEYSTEQTTDCYSFNKHASMSVEFAR